MNCHPHQRICYDSIRNHPKSSGWSAIICWSSFTLQAQRSVLRLVHIAWHLWGDGWSWAPWAPGSVEIQRYGDAQGPRSKGPRSYYFLFNSLGTFPLRILVNFWWADFFGQSTLRPIRPSTVRNPFLLLRSLRCTCRAQAPKSFKCGPKSAQ